jgi:hypothetical protein
MPTLPEVLAAEAATAAALLRVQAQQLVVNTTSGLAKIAAQTLLTTLTLTYNTLRATSEGLRAAYDAANPPAPIPPPPVLPPLPPPEPVPPVVPTPTEPTPTPDPPAPDPTPQTDPIDAAGGQCLRCGRRRRFAWCARNWCS